jgi:competence protein ComEA
MEKKEKLIGSIIMIVGCTIFLIVGYILSKPSTLDKEDVFAKNNINSKSVESKVVVDNTNAETTKNNMEDLKSIIVEIKGEVKKPSVYTLSYGSRIYDLIEEAGGFTEKADTMSINSSMKLKDEDCIIIYSKEQIHDINSNNTNNTNTINNTMNINKSKSTLLKSESGKINLNSATKEELMTLPGIGEITAQKIIDYREEKGGFSSIDELKNISRIGDKTIEKFIDKIEVR